MNRSDSPWWYAYYGISIHRAEELGFSKIKPVRQALARGIISQVMDSSVTGPDGKWVGPEPHGAYRQMITQPDGQSAQSWLAVFNAIERSTTIVNAIGSGDASLLIADQCTNSNYGSIGVGSSSMWIDGGQYFRIDGGTANEEIIQTGCSCSNAVPYSTVTMTGGTCPGKRGALGTTAKAHAAGATFERLFLRASDAFYSSKESGQYNQSVGAASLAYDVSAPDTLNGRVYTGLRAVEVMRAVQALQNWDSDTSCTSVTSNPSRNCMNWMWAILPPQTIGGAQVLPGTTSALLTWTAPDTYACRVGVSSAAFTSSDDTADSVSPAGPAARSYTATGLMGQTNYFYRITCGSGGGTSRFSGTFKTN